MYGCVLLDIFSDTCDQLWSTWHRTVKSIFKLPLPTHKCLVNDLVDCDHIKKSAIKRLISFSSKIAASSNPHIQLLHVKQKRDWRSTYGRNYMNICALSHVDAIHKVDHNEIVINPVPPGEEWRVNFLQDVLSERDSETCSFSDAEMTLLLKEICCSVMSN